MTSRSKERVTAAIRRIFRTTPERNDSPSSPLKAVPKTQNGPAAVAANNSPMASPARRLLRCRDAVSPAANLDLVANAGVVPQQPSKSSRLQFPGASFFKSKRKTAEPKATASSPSSSGSSSSSSKPPSHPSEQAAGHGKAVRTKRLMKELKEIQRLQKSSPTPSFTAELVNDNLYEWHVRLYAIDPESDLSRDMREHGLNHILISFTFPDNFPFAPPFMRVVTPRIEKGFVMEGGAICMELLTPRGWASAYTVEAIVMQFAASIVKGQGRIARKPKGSKDFTRRTAEESFRSLVKTHEKYGWVTPPLADG
ncbi:Hypothetical predicted protein [Cloeon dipterum]|uniref:E2 ubiquitin-conjugating enzyme n=1 Tax=Cloeon dipterum TaxID=197152 RepID=A0A8S1E3C4_9INSE|nr:Hypothetical predicted protein [Cloeon dipterum]